MTLSSAADANDFTTPQQPCKMNHRSQRRSSGSQNCCTHVTLWDDSILETIRTHTHEIWKGACRPADGSYQVAGKSASPEKGNLPKNMKRHTITGPITLDVLILADIFSQSSRRGRDRRRSEERVTPFMPQQKSFGRSLAKATTVE